MKELKKLSKRELSRIRAIQQVSHQLAHMVNIILRKYPNNERYKGRTQLRLILDNIDKRLSIYECKLNHNGGAIVGFYNKLFLIIDRNDDCSVDITSSELTNLIITHNDILELLLDLTNDRGYKYIKPLYTEEHAIMIYDKAIFNSIECNTFSDKNYYKINCDRTKYVSKDEEMGAFICRDLKAAYVKNGKVFIGGEI